MNKYIADSMAFILRLENRKMPLYAKKKFEMAEKGQAEIVVPAMVFAELAYLSERNKIDTNLNEAKKYLDKYTLINEYPLTYKTVTFAFSIDDIPELHDRLIAAVGKELDAEVITNDPVIEHSRHVKTIWK